jgi:Lysyl oxidase
MRLVRWKAGCAVMAAAGITVTLVTVPGMTAASATKVAGPAVKLIVAQKTITAGQFRKRVSFDPGIWLGSLGSPLEFDVSRTSYGAPITITQVIHPSSGETVRKPWPATVLAGWNGLKDFARMTVRNSAGTVVATRQTTFCPNSYDPERAVPDGPASSPYAFQCRAMDPFQLGMVWGIQADWAAEPFAFGRTMRLPLGTYKATVTISPTYVNLLHITAADATATVTVKVVKATRGCCFSRASRRHAGAHAVPRSAPAVRAPANSQPAVAVPTLTSPPQSALPDMAALPSWGINAFHRSGRDLLSFGATVWVGGNSPLDVEGFRSDGSPVMPAYQYFWRDGQVIGRAPAGTMGFDTRPGHNHWHFQQFAQYQLLNKAKKLAVRSHKQGFCIAPTDPVDLLNPNANAQSAFLGFGGRCGFPSALWVQEVMPVGWGDTYEQSVAGQAFDITHVPNGTYYIEIMANPERVLHETDTSNDNSFRKVILGGTPGHRTVKVPAVHGIDPEH